MSVSQMAQYFQCFNSVWTMTGAAPYAVLAEYGGRRNSGEENRGDGDELML